MKKLFLILFTIIVSSNLVAQESGNNSQFTSICKICKALVKVGEMKAHGESCKAVSVPTGTVSTGTVSPHMAAVYCPLGFEIVNGKCIVKVNTNSEIDVRWTPIVPRPKGFKSYTISSGMLNSKKELLSKKEILNLLRISIPTLNESLLTIELVDAKPVLLALSEDKNTLIKIPLLQDKGYLVLADLATISTLNGTKQETISQAIVVKNDYIGHVTLLR